MRSARSAWPSAPPPGPARPAWWSACAPSRGLLGAVLYVVSPLDLVPEAILPLVGLGDDAIVIAWIATALVNQTEGFLAWERQREQTVRGDVIS